MNAKRMIEKVMRGTDPERVLEGFDSASWDRRVNGLARQFQSDVDSRTPNRVVVRKTSENRRQLL